METFRMDDRRSTRHLSKNKKGEENSAQLNKHNGVMTSEELEEAVYRNYSGTFGPDDLRLVKKRPKWKNTLFLVHVSGYPCALMSGAVCAETISTKGEVSMIVPFKFPHPHSLNADEFEDEGSKWNPQLHFTGTLDDPAENRFIESLLQKYGKSVVAHYIYSPYIGTYSIELQFGDDTESRNAMVECLDEYESAFTATGKLKAKVAKEHTLTSGPFQFVVVPPSRPAEIVAVEHTAFEKFVESVVEEFVEVLPYPKHLGLPLKVIASEKGIQQGEAYNRWGLVGGFIVTRFDNAGRKMSLKEAEARKVIEHLKRAEDGYLNPESGVVNCLQGPFKVHGVPPSGWVPDGGRWFR